MADGAAPFTLQELATRTADAARAEILAINHIEFMAGAGDLAGAVVADIRRQAAALALASRVMTQIALHPGALGLDLAALEDITRQLDGDAA